MSFSERAKSALNQAREKAGELADKHGDSIDKAVDKAGTFVDDKTKGKYSEKIDKAQSAAKDAAGKIATHQPGTTRAADGPVPPATPPEPPVVPPTDVPPNPPKQG